MVFSANIRILPHMRKRHRLPGELKFGSEVEPDFGEVALGHLQHISRVGEEHVAVVAVFGHKLVFPLLEVVECLGIVALYPAGLI